MAQNIKTVQGITLANTKTIQGIAIANIKTIQGIDNTGGGFTPSDLTTLKRWIDTSQFVGFSDNDPISTAADFSGQGNSLTGSGSQRPTYQTNITNSLPGMQFVAASSQLLSGSAVSTGTEAFWWCVFQPDTISSLDVELFSTRANNSYYRFQGDGNGYVGYYKGDRIDGYPTAVPTTGVNIMVGLSTTGTYNIWINGSAQGAQTAQFNSEDYFNLGTYVDGIRHWNGFIFEFGMCDSDESASRGDLETYLAAKWQ